MGCHSRGYIGDFSGYCPFVSIIKLALASSALPIPETLTFSSAGHNETLSKHGELDVALDNSLPTFECSNVIGREIKPFTFATLIGKTPVPISFYSAWIICCCIRRGRSTVSMAEVIRRIFVNVTKISSLSFPSSLAFSDCNSVNAVLETNNTGVAHNVGSMSYE